MRNRSLSGWRQFVLYAVVASFALTPVFAGGKDRVTSTVEDTQAHQPMAMVDRSGQNTDDSFRPATLYARSNYIWPYGVPTPYGTVSGDQLHAQGVLRTMVGTLLITDLQVRLPVELQTTNQLDVLAMQYFIIDLDQAWLRQRGAAQLSALISAAGGEVVGGMPVSAVIARLTPGALAEVQAQPGVNAVVAFQSAFKLHPSIGQMPLADPIKAVSEIYELDVTLFPGEDGHAVASEIVALGGEVTVVAGSSIRAWVNRAKLGQLADIQAIATIHEAYPNSPFGEETTITMQTGGFQGRGTIGPYHLAGVNGSGNGVTGTTNQVLMLIDTGVQLDAADLADTDSTAGAASSTHRKVIAYRPASDFSGLGDGKGCDDPPAGAFTHGHLVAATAIGNATNIVDLSTGWNPMVQFTALDTNDLEWALDGVAPGAKVTVLDASRTPAASACSDPVLNDITEGPNYYTGLNLNDPCPGATCPGFLQLYYRDDDARVTNMSYGTDVNTYDTDARQIDQFLYDKQDAMVFAAAGNGGTDADNDGRPDLGSVASPSTNRNGVSVGRSNNASLFDGAENRSFFSAVGPAEVDPGTPWETDPVNSLDRIQPLLMAPGGDGSTLGVPSEFACRSSDNDQNDPVECDIAQSKTGTSYASAAAAGAALLVRDYFAQGFYPTGAQETVNSVPNISGALVKALLVASADFLNGGNTPTDYRFNNEQGYGRIQLDNVLPLQTWAPSITGLIVADGGIVGGPNNLSGLDGVLNGTVAGETDSQTFEVCTPHPVLRVALAWMDRPATGDSGTLNTDLDLELVAPDGTTVYFGNYFTDDDNRDFVIDLTTEDCPDIKGGSGGVFPNESQWSLPVCTRGDGTLSPHDVANPTEAIFLSDDYDGDGITVETDLDPADDDQIQIGTWTVRVKVKDTNPDGTPFTPGPNADSAQRYAVVISGAGCLGSSIRFDSGSYVCNARATVTVNELAESPALNASTISARTIIEVYDSLGALVDTESGLLFSVQPGSESYESDTLFLTDKTARDSGNGVLDVRDGDTLRVIYTDTDNGSTEISEALVKCQLRIASGGIVFGQFGLDVGTSVNGGCERNARGLFEFGFPDRYLDEDERIILSVAIGSQETELVNNIVAALRCVEADDALAPEDCLPGTSNCLNPNRLITGPDAMTPCPSSDLIITNSPIGISELPANQAIGINFNLQMGSTIDDMKEVEFVLELTSRVSGLSGTAVAVFRNTLDADVLAVLYSTDFPTGGSEFSDWNNNEFMEGDTSTNSTPTENAGDFLRDYRFETRVFSDMTAGGTKNAAAVANAPWNFDSNDGGFTNGIGAGTDDASIANAIAQWGEDKNFNNMLDGFCAIGHCVDDPTRICSANNQCVAAGAGDTCIFDAQGWCGGVVSGTQCTDFDDPGDPDLTPEDCEGDPNGVTCDLVTCQDTPGACTVAMLAGLFRCISESEDIDPPSFLLENVWNTDGGCGWQTAIAGTCNPSGNTCYIDGDCPGVETCDLISPSRGMWHTGRIGPFGGAGCLGTGNVIEQCQGIEVVLGETGERLWFELLMTPPMEQVDDNADSVEILNFAWNQALDLEDGNIAWTWEVDGETDKINPVDLTSDLAFLNLGFGGYTPRGGATGQHQNNPELTNGFSMFAPVFGVDNLTRNGTLGGNRHGQNACYFEGTGVYNVLTLGEFGFAGPRDDDVNNGHCPGNSARVCSEFCIGGTEDRAGCSLVGGGDAACINGGGVCTLASTDATYNRCEVTDTCVANVCTISGGACPSGFDIECRTCIYDNSTIDEYVFPNGPIRNMDLFAFNGPDLRFTTVEDFVGETGSNFQAAIGIINFEKEDSDLPDPAASYGIGVDDVVFEWQELTLIPDATDCSASGSCANIDSSVGASFTFATFLDITVQDTTPSNNDCNDDGANTGNTLGVCASNLCSGDAGLACTDDMTCALEGAGTCTATLTCVSDAVCGVVLAGVCNTAANQDDTDCNNNGIADVRITGKSENEPDGEHLTMDCVAPSGATCPDGEYFGFLPISATYDSPGVLFVQAQGVVNPVVELNYFDFDDGTGQVCQNSLIEDALGLVQAFTTISLEGGNLALVKFETTDNGDEDVWADTNETIDMIITVRNQTGSLLNNVVARLASSDPKIDCILSAVIDIGTIPPDDPDTPGLDEGVVRPDTPFVFRIASTANRVGECALSVDSCGENADCPGGGANTCDAGLREYSASLTVLFSADEFDTALGVQAVTMPLDLDASGGGTPIDVLESFEAAPSLGIFTIDNMDSFDVVAAMTTNQLEGSGGHGGSLAKSDGYRCSFDNPDYIQSENFLDTNCYLGVDVSHANNVWWRTVSERAFSGLQSVAWTSRVDDTIEWTTPTGVMEALQTIDPYALAFKDVCSNAPAVQCLDDGDCPGGFCVPPNPRITWKHQISMMDWRGVGPNQQFRSADGGVVSIQQANTVDKSPVGVWIKVETVGNAYDSQRQDNFTGACSFDPVDDGNDEDDFFDPSDPFARFGPSSTCFPEFVYSWQGDTDGPFDPLETGNAQGPGLQGSHGVGTWVESVVDLKRFQAQYVRFRYLVSSLKVDTTWQAAFTYDDSDPRDDGWFIDDFRVLDAISFPALLQGDVKANASVCSGDGTTPCVDDTDCGGNGNCQFPSCGTTCGMITPSLVTDPLVPLAAPGQVVELSAVASLADRCVGGVLQYRFWIDENDNQMGFESGTDTLIRNWSENPLLLEAPADTTNYAADSRCSADISCLGTAYNTVSVTCPTSSGGAFPTITADGSNNKNAFQWAGGAINYAFGEGLLSTLSSSYTTSASNTGLNGSSHSLVTDDAWLLLRTDEAGGGGEFCNSGGPGNYDSGGAPGRDAGGTGLP